MRLDVAIRLWEPPKYLAAGVGARTFDSVASMLNAMRSRDLAKELQDCIDEPGKVLYLKIDDYIVIAREDHVHVLRKMGRKIIDVDVETARRVIEELKKRIGEEYIAEK